MGTKYIRMGSKFFTFDDHIPHIDFAQSQGYPRMLVHGAGFVKYSTVPDEDGYHLQCYGESISLRIPSREDDTAGLNAQLDIIPIKASSLV